ncbi:RHOMBOID-like protein 2 [Brachypodium distachyon]|uniref:RHOMBOID-like protein n=1 Tax=Brachypodium distachyon TaxID=15368 RepID=I1I979_BRADI|nr:RHOMBOID-like protein 2 [Brachypodium distachyon]KQJ99263.1 hypothetical protein BRADI_3g42110v3 [Brachypodium distachyon]|eukprot:XP_003572482.1 RHOMBOID-like protein 2 [Brachypodium distachyon]
MAIIEVVDGQEIMEAMANGAHGPGVAVAVVMANDIHCTGGAMALTMANGVECPGIIKVGPNGFSIEMLSDPLARFWPMFVPYVICVCVSVFSIVMYVNDCPGNTPGAAASCVAAGFGRVSFQPIHENPLLGPSYATLEKMGALDWAKVVHGHQISRLFTCFWVHAGLIHLFVTQLSLCSFGVRFEQQFGFLRIVIIYLLSGLGGSVLSALFLPAGSVSVGASGPVLGLIGAMVSEIAINWNAYSNRKPALAILGLIAVINMVMGIFPHTDNFTNIGGFLTGFLLGFLVLADPARIGFLPQSRTSEQPKYKSYHYAVFGASLLLLLVGFAVALTVLFEGKNGGGGGGGLFLNCVPTSGWKCSSGA